MASNSASDEKNFLNKVRELNGGRMTVMSGALASTAYQMNGGNGRQLAQDAKKAKQFLDTDNSSASRYATQDRYARR